MIDGLWKELTLGDPLVLRVSVFRVRELLVKARFSRRRNFVKDSSRNETEIALNPTVNLQRSGERGSRSSHSGR